MAAIYFELVIAVVRQIQVRTLMGMHIGLIAARTSVTKLIQAFAQAWPDYEVVAKSGELRDAEAMWSWHEKYDHPVSAADWTPDNPGKRAIAFWQDGPWGVMLDSSYVLSDDEDGMAALSARLGIVVSFVVETAGGCAFFCCFENGELRRRISNDGADISTDGEPVPQEAGIDISNYYMDESESLWKAFGLSRFDEMPTQTGCQAICVIDRSDYNDI